MHNTQPTWHKENTDNPTRHWKWMFIHSLSRLFCLLFIVWCAYRFVFIEYPIYPIMILVVLVQIIGVLIAQSRIRFLYIVIFAYIMYHGVFYLGYLLSSPLSIQLEYHPDDFSSSLYLFYSQPVSWVGLYVLLGGWLSFRWYFFHYIEIIVLILLFLEIMKPLTTQGLEAFAGVGDLSELIIYVLTFFVSIILYAALEYHRRIREQHRV